MPGGHGDLAADFRARLRSTQTDSSAIGSSDRCLEATAQCEELAACHWSELFVARHFGYMYMGKIVAGILGMLVVIMVYVTTPVEVVFRGLSCA